MKQYQISNAYDALGMMAAFKLPAKISYELWSLAKKLEPEKMFVEEKKKQLLSEYHGQVNERGYVQFPSHEEEQAFIDALNEVAGIDVDIDITPVEVPMACLNGIELAMSDIVKLEGFVRFTETEA